MSIKAREVTVGSTPLVAALARHLLAERLEVDLDGFGVIGTSELLSDFASALEKRDLLKTLSARLKAEGVAQTRLIDERRAALKEVTSALAKALQSAPGAGQQGELSERETALKAQIADVEAASAKASGVVDAADAIVTGFDAFVTDLTSVPATGDGYPPLLAAAMRERLHVEGGTAYTHVLYAGVESAAGETITKRRLFQSPRIRYVGGLHLSYLLLNVADNSLAAAGALPLLGHVDYGLKDFRPQTPSTVGPKLDTALSPSQAIPSRSGSRR
jgi:hypothetical protein